MILTLAVCEWKKLWKRKSVWVTLGVMVVLIVGIACVSLIGVTDVNGKTMTYMQKMKMEREYARSLSGRPMDDALLAEIRADGGSGAYRPVEAVIQSFAWNFEGSRPLDEETLYQARREYQQVFFDAYRMSEKEQKYWKEWEEQIKLPMVYGYAGAWENLVNNYLYMIGLMILFLTAICVPGVFTEEHSRRTDQVILCTRYGRKELYFGKILAGSLFSAVCGCLLLLAALACELVIYGPDGFGAAIQLSIIQYGLPLSVGAIFLIAVLLLLFVSLFAGILAMFLAELTRRWVGTMAALIGAALVVRIVQFPSTTDLLRWVGQFWNYLPANLLHKESLFDLRLVSVFGMQLTIWQFAPILYFLAAVLLVWAGKRIYCSYQVQGR